MMEMRRRVLGEKHPDTLTSIVSLAMVLWGNSDGKRRRRWAYRRLR